MIWCQGASYRLFCWHHGRVDVCCGGQNLPTLRACLSSRMMFSPRVCPSPKMFAHHFLHYGWVLLQGDWVVKAILRTIAYLPVVGSEAKLERWHHILIRHATRKLVLEIKSWNWAWVAPWVDNQVISCLEPNYHSKGLFLVYDTDVDSPAEPSYRPS